MRLWTLLAVVLAALPVAAVSDAASGPRLTLVDRTPVVLSGTGFVPGTQVVVTVRAPSLVLSRPIRVGATGGFRLRVPTLSLSGRLRCAYGVTIIARRQGAELLLWRPPRLPDCAAPLPVRPS